jgi:outer membrane protein OmpA-like peptidoglycan-associated protein
MLARRRLFALLAAAWAPVLVAAAPPTDAEVRRMVEALAPAASRVTRNLVVRQRPADAAAPAASAPAEAPRSLELAIQFEPDKADVRPASGALLGDLVAALLSPELRDRSFLIEGHAEARGPGAARLRLSQERANEVRAYLVALGVAPARLKAVGRGVAAAAQPLVRVVAIE